MLSKFLATNRELLLTRAKQRIAARDTPLATELELTQGLPLFFDQLVSALRNGTAPKESDHSELLTSAGEHGQAVFQKGLTVSQLVHDYGGLCQVITGLAAERNLTIPADEFQTLNRCLDDAIAAAVTEFARQREHALGAAGTERLGVLAHEARNFLNTAMLALASIRKGVVAVGGSTGAILERSLTSLQTLIDRSFADVRLEAGLQARERISVKEIVDEIEIGAAMFAQVSGLRLTVHTVDDDDVVVEADRDILTAAINNLLQNAFKFSRAGTTIELRASSSATRVLFEIEDECGGLPAGRKESLLVPFVQRGADRTGLGLGLSICVKSMQTMGGELRVRDLPGKGCIFTLDLPRRIAPAARNGMPTQTSSA